MAIKNYHLNEQPIPDGFQILEPHLDVAGLHARKADVVKFVSAKNHWLEFQRDANNRYDHNAIRVLGCTKGFLGVKRRFIGFVPKEIAAAIVHTDLVGRASPRLTKTYMSDKGFVEVEFQLLAPKTEKARYQSYWSDRPASLLQKEFYRFMGESPPKNITFGAAKAYQAEVEANHPNRAQEWQHFVDIWEEISDPLAREDYELKKISIAQLCKTIQALQKDGRQLEELADDVDAVVEKILDLKPDLRRAS